MNLPDTSLGAVATDTAGHTELQVCAIAARQQCRPQLLLDFIPYSSFIGAQAKISDGIVLYWLEPRRSNIGNPTLPAIHGGVIGGFLELSASIELLYNFGLNTLPKTIDFSLDHLRPGHYQTLYASCRILRKGNQLVNASITAWQIDVDLPVATARCHFLIN